MQKLVIPIILLLLNLSSQSQAPKILSFSPKKAGEKGYVYIYGQHLTGVHSVTFGGVPALSHFVFHDTLMIANTGKVASGYLMVANDHGRDSLAGFTFMLPPQFLSAAPLTAAHGDTIIIQGLHLASIEQIYLGDSLAPDFNIINDTTIKLRINNVTSGSIKGFSNYGETSLEGFNFLGPFIKSFAPTRGTKGSSIAINGHHFTSATKVKFGNVEALSFEVITDSLINAVVGDGEPGYVQVETSKGKAAAPYFGLPTIQSFSPYWGTRFDTIYINGFNFTGVDHLSFGDSSAVFFKVLSDKLIQAVVGNGRFGKITVQAAGITTSSTDNFQFLRYTTRINSFAPTTATEQTKIIISGQQLYSTDSVKFGGVPAKSFKVLSNSTIEAIVGDAQSGSVSILNNRLWVSIPGFTYLPSPPFISSFSPASGIAGTELTINGWGFSSNADSNQVNFGSVRAEVKSASKRELKVIVPPVTDYKPISVTYNNLTGYSRIPFLQTFSGNSVKLDSTAFQQQVAFSTTASNPAKLATGDFDNDGRIDIAVVYGFFGNNHNIVSVYRNLSNFGTISLAKPENFTIGAVGSSWGYNLATADINSDGKIDIIIVSPYDKKISILKNTSSPGRISFSQNDDIFIVTNPDDLVIEDFNGDGRPDLMLQHTGYIGSSSISYFENTSKNGVISFAPKTDYLFTGVYGLATGNLNDDNKPDLVCRGSYANGLAIKQNTSIGEKFSFEHLGEPFAQNKQFTKLAFGDLDNDGRVDMIGINSPYTVFVFKNVGIENNSSIFDSPITISVDDNIHSVALADMDGDGKIDINLSLETMTVSHMAVLKNTSSTNDISFEKPIKVPVGKSPADIICADLTGDGKPEVITANQNEGSISVVKNNIGGPLRLCPPIASFSIEAGFNGNSYQWQVDTGKNSFINLTDNSQYSGTASSRLNASGIQSSFTGYKYRCKVDNNYTTPISIKFENRWLGMYNALWKTAANWSCGVLPDAFTDAIISDGIVILNSNGICRTLTVMPGSDFTVYPGSTLTITHP